MKLASIKELDGLKPVLKDQKSLGPDPVYWVFSEVSLREGWDNITIISPGNLNGEYPKTFGHYHSQEVDEVYRLLEGEGIFIMQKKHFEEGKWVPEMVDAVFLIRAKVGDEITITPEYGHSWSNVGKCPLIAYDNWTWGHQPSDYEDIKRLQGLAYYLVEENGQVKAIPNTRYQNLPQPTWTTAEEFKKLSTSSLFSAFSFKRYPFDR